jgi:hypothetical protein
VGNYGEPTSLALVAELSGETQGRILVHRLTCAVDCGFNFHDYRVARLREASQTR